MAHLIDKSALVAEIRKRLLPVIRDKHYDEWEEGQNSERVAILDIIDKLKVKDADSTLQNGWSYKDETMRLAIEYIFYCAPLVGIISENTENLKSWLRDIKKRMSCLE